MSDEPLEHPNQAVADRPPDRRAWPVPVLVILCLALYLPGVNWGLPAVTSWSQDTIAGIRTLGAVESWPDQWRGRYPPLHYLVLRAIYTPYVKHLITTDEAEIDPLSGRVLFKPPQHEKVGTLILIARLVSVAMAIGAVLGMYLAARRRAGDAGAAFVAAFVLASGAAFVYFAHLGNVDVPSMFWLAVSVVCYVRLAATRSIADAVLLGLSGSLAISTKDSVAGVYPGMAIALLAVEAARVRGNRPWLAAAGAALARRRWLAGIVAFVLPYLLLNGVFHDHEPYVNRMSYWLGLTPGTTHMRQPRYDNQLALFGATLWYAAGAFGWPMLVATVASVIHAIKRHPRAAWFMLVPACSYYLAVIAPQGFVYSRFLFPPLALLSVLVGIACRDFVRARRLPAGLRFGVVAFVAVTTLGYAVAINLEMLGDSRYAAEAWFDSHVDRGASVGACSKPQYLPRLPEMGYQTYGVEMTRAAFNRPQPDYLVVTSYHYEDYDEPARSCLHALLREELGYELVATFRGRYLGTGSSWLSLAAWAAPEVGKISPTVTVLKRKSP